MAPTTGNRQHRRWAKQAEAAEHIGVNPRTLRKYVAEGLVPAHRIGRMIRFDLNEVDASLQRVPTFR